MLDMLINSPSPSTSKVEAKSQEGEAKNLLQLLGERGAGQENSKEFLKLLSSMEEEGSLDQAIKLLESAPKEEGDNVQSTQAQLQALLSLLQSENPELNAELIHNEKTQKGANKNPSEVLLLLAAKQQENGESNQKLNQQAIRKSEVLGQETLQNKSTQELPASKMTKESWPKELMFLKSHGPDLAFQSKSKVSGQLSPLFTAQDFIDQKSSGEQNNSGQTDKAASKLQGLSQYMDGQKQTDTRLLGGAKLGQQLAQGPSVLEGTSESEDDGQALNSSKLLKEVGVLKGAQAPQAAGMDAKATDLGKSILDMGKLDFSRPQQVIDKIVEYLDKVKFENTQNLDLLVKHDKLGNFNLQVQKSARGGEFIDLRIHAQTQEAHQFFKEHEAELMKALNKSGVRLTDLKIIQSSGDSSLAQNSQDKEGQQQLGQRSNGSQQEPKNQEQRDSQRRRELWQEYKERLGA